jgi:uncharacterized protein YraI
MIVGRADKGISFFPGAYFDRRSGMNARFMSGSPPGAPSAQFRVLRPSNHQEMAMRLHNKIISLALASTVLLGTAGAAFAAQAVATGNVNVRSGPSASYQRVDTLRRNEVVEVTGCRGGWCYVEKRGPDGWVSAQYLQAAGRHHQSAKPSINFSFSFGTPPAPPRPHRPSQGGWDGHSGGGWNDRDDNWNGGWDRNRPRHRDWND